MQVPATVARPGEGFAYKWIVAIVVVFGIFMAVLDSTIVNIAIPRLQSAFGANLNSVQWVLTGYTLAQGVATPITAFLSDRLGIKRLYLVSLIGFTLGSALCGLAWSLPMLIVFRIVQGISGAFMAPLAMTMLYREFPPNERGMAMSVLGIPILLAPAFGPTLGGYIVTFADWPLIFYINVPVGILGVLLGSMLLQEIPGNRNASFDIPGFLFATAGLGCLLYALSDASTDGWGSTRVLGFLSAGIVLLAIFTVIELVTASNGGQPLLDLRVFGNRAFTTSSIASILVTFALFGGLFLIPVYLQNLRHLSAYQAGLVLLPQAFASMIAMFISGRLVDKFGVKAAVIPGLLVLIFAMWLFTGLTLTIPLLAFQGMLIIRSLSLGFCMQPLNVSALSEIEPRQLPLASSVSTTLRFVSMSLGVALIATVVQAQTKIHYAHLAELVTPASPLGQLLARLQALFVSQGASLAAARSAAARVIWGLLQQQAYVLGMRDAFWLSAGLAVIALIAAFFVGGSRKQAQLAQRPTSHKEEQEEEDLTREEALLGI
ncbi:MAG: DHA2 family efflux MFS transporter permease subunit [Ktedonobacteraceae bacterium]|nr:DHA2 family efflux MFS transporter permease subunit [Ktedonobacteraceae bacterium]